VGDPPAAHWELVEKAGFLSGPMDDKVGSVDEAKKSGSGKA